MNPTLGAGCPPEYSTPFRGFSLSINAKDVAEAERPVRRHLRRRKGDHAAGEDIWAERFGMCTDRFGVSWMVSCEMRAPERL